MALNIDVKFEGKMTCAFKNDMRNLANFYQRTFESLKIWILLGPFIQSRKCMSLKYTGDLCVMTMKNVVKFDQKLMGQFNYQVQKTKVYNV